MSWTEGFGSVVGTITGAYSDISRTQAESQAIKNQNSNMSNLSGFVGQVAANENKTPLYLAIGGAVLIVVILLATGRRRRR